MRRPSRCEGVCMGGILPVFASILYYLQSDGHRTSPSSLADLRASRLPRRRVGAGCRVGPGAADGSAAIRGGPQSQGGLPPRLRQVPPRRTRSSRKAGRERSGRLPSLRCRPPAARWSRPRSSTSILDYLTRNHGRESVIVPGAAGRGAAGRGPRAHVGAADRHRVDDAAADAREEDVCVRVRDLPRRRARGGPTPART